MINKSKTSKVWRWEVQIFLPLLVLLLMAFGNRSERPIVKNILNEKPSLQQSKHDVQNKKQFTLIVKIVPDVVEKENGILEITKNGVEKSKIDIHAKESYWLHLDYFSEYSLIFRYPNHIDKTILVSTVIPKEVWEKNSNFPEFPMIVNLIKKDSEEEKSEISKSVLKVAYIKEIDNFGKVTTNER